MNLGPSDPFLSPEEFAILPWGWTSATAETLDGIRRCGFNLAGFVQAEDLDLVAATGLKAIVYDANTHVTDEAAVFKQPEIIRRVQALTDRVQHHPALFAYYLRDEPGASIYPGLARWAEAYRAIDPTGRVYINLFPNYALPRQMNVATYSEYIRSFLEQVAPPFLSYDHYALMEDGSLRSLYFLNLEAIRSAAIEAGLPFWNIILSNAHFEYAEPTPAGLRFQVYTSLAYGVRGISFYTYFTPDVGNFRLAPIDAMGFTTPTWEMVRQVNLQIHRLGRTYLRLNSRHVFHTPDIPPGASNLESSLLLDDIHGGSFVVGEFEATDGRPHILVVNKDLGHSAPVVFRFRQKGRILRTSSSTGVTTPLGSEDSWLAPGQGVLLALDPD